MTGESRSRAITIVAAVWLIFGCLGGVARASTSTTTLTLQANPHGGCVARVEHVEGPDPIALVATQNLSPSALPCHYTISTPGDPYDPANLPGPSPSNSRATRIQPVNYAVDSDQPVTWLPLPANAMDGGYGPITITSISAAP